MLISRPHFVVAFLASTLLPSVCAVCDPCLSVEGNFSTELEYPGEDGKEGGSCGEMGEILPFLEQQSAPCLALEALSLACCGEGLVALPCFIEHSTLHACEESNTCECDEDFTFDDDTIGFDICEDIPENPQAALTEHMACCPQCTTEVIELGACVVTECQYEPIAPPTNAPVKPPTDAPVKPPTDAPVKPPTDAPVRPPTDAPVKPPTDAPVKPPVHAPVKPIFDPPVDALVDAPTDEVDSGGLGYQAVFIGLAALVTISVAISTGRWIIAEKNRRLLVDTVATEAYPAVQYPQYPRMTGVEVTEDGVI